MFFDFFAIHLEIMKTINEKILIICIIIVVLLVLVESRKLVNDFFGNKEVKMNITGIFANGEKIPSVYTCDGQNISPELIISEVPPQTQSLVLIVDDPDAPVETFTHWLLYNIPADTVKINSSNLPQSAVQGINDFGKAGYGGPCPPSGEHRYYFKLYALDKGISKEKLTKSQLQEQIKGHVIEQAELIGIYSRK